MFYDRDAFFKDVKVAVKLQRYCVILTDSELENSAKWIQSSVMA
jgi:hypothetical protein